MCFKLGQLLHDTRDEIIWLSDDIISKLYEYSSKSI